LSDIHYNQAEPAFFVRGASPIARFVFFSALSLALIATDSHLKYLQAIRSNLEAYLHPLELMANAPGTLYREVNRYFASHHHLLDENQVLKNQLIKKNADLQALKQLTVENAHLRQLINEKTTLQEQSILGEILYVSRDRFSKKVVVNRGEVHNVALGSAVMDGDGIIGQVTRVFSHTSVVTLITDKNLEIPVFVERNGLRAIAFGHGQNNVIEIPYLPTNVDIKVGDTLVTSGIDGVYPAGVAVAMVKKIETMPGSPFAKITCQPTGGVEHHGMVLLVNKPVDVSASHSSIDALSDGHPTGKYLLPDSNKQAPSGSLPYAEPQPISHNLQNHVPE